MDDWGLGISQPSIEDTVTAEYEAMKSEKKEQTNMFNIIASAVDKKFVPTQEELGKITPYMFLRYFSNDPSGLMIVSELNIRNNIPKEWEYWFMRLLMPASIRYIKYTKKEKFEDQDLLDCLTHYYKCNEKQAIEYYNMLPPDEVQKIRDKYRHGLVKKSR